jgi:hypothetical protein
LKNPIARELGVTPAGLELLCRKAAGKGGDRNQGLQGLGFGAPQVAKPLERACYLARDDKGIFRITDAGRAIVAKARTMGW